MNSFRIAVLDDYQRLALRVADWSALQRRADVVTFDRHLTNDAVQELRDFDAVCHLRERMAFPRSLIEQLPRLKFITITGQRHRTLDEQACAERGIVVSFTPGSEQGRSATSELAWGLILALARHIPAEVHRMKHHGWQTTCGQVLRGKTLGLVGLGKLGAQMVPVARAFGMDVLAWSPNLTAERAQSAGATWVSKRELFSRSDFVSLHLVLGESTRGVIGRADLACLQPHAYVVNTARAGLVDEDALYDLLANKRIAGAALDTFEVEPLPDDFRFRRLDNVILTPHLGYTVEETLRAFYKGTVEALEAFLSGAPIRLLNSVPAPSQGNSH